MASAGRGGALTERQQLERALRESRAESGVAPSEEELAVDADVDDLLALPARISPPSFARPSTACGALSAAPLRIRCVALVLAQQCRRVLKYRRARASGHTPDAAATVMSHGGSRGRAVLVRARRLRCTTAKTRSSRG